jgi:hypothetical protein
VVDVAVNPENPTEFYVGYALEDYGIPIITECFSAVMDTAPTQNIVISQ